MSKILAIIRYTVTENVRHKIFYVLLLFAFVVIGADILLGFLAGEQQARLLLDFGLGAIETFGFMVTVFAAVNLILEEIESKTIYLLLSRPIRRAEYVVGRYLGMSVTVLTGLVLMVALHLIFLVSVGWTPVASYFVSVFGILLKILLIAAVAMFFSLFSTSAVASAIFTVFFWMLGHFGTELRFLSSKISNLLLKAAVKFFFFVTPNFQYMNFRDRPETGAIAIAVPVIYTAVYSAICLALCTAMFSKKEF
jgi:ABC-type transport system involved in multi-copper enzyme maturation permease subunit